MRQGWLVAMLLPFAACIQPDLVPCGELACSVGDVCTSVGCANPADITVCDGQPDGSVCKLFGGGSGNCVSGVCRAGLCGNNHLDPGEACDDGNETSGDGCRADCLKVERCGDGVLDDGEPCDDGNVNPADGCDACAATTWQATAVVGSPVAALATGLKFPTGLAIDGAGRIFVVDNGTARVQRIELDGSITTIAGTGATGLAGDGGPATSAELDNPHDVAIDGLGRVFIAETTRVQRIDLDGSLVTVAGTTVSGFSGDGGPAVGARLNGVAAVTVDGFGRLYLADAGNQRIRRVDENGTIATIAGTGVGGLTGDGGPATSATLNGPSDLWLDAVGRLVFCERVNSVVRRIEINGTLTRLAGTGVAGFSGDGGQAVAAQLNFPGAIAIDSLGRIVIADAGNRIRRIASDGTISTLAGTGAASFGGDGGPAISAAVDDPQGMAIDGTGRIVVSDTRNFRIRRIDAAAMISTIAGTGANDAGGDGGAATAAALVYPSGLAIDTMGRVYITDTADYRIRRVNTDGTITSIAGTGEFGFSGDGGPATVARLSQAQAVAVDPMGRVVIADTDNARIRRVELDGTIHTIAGIGPYGFSGDGGPAIDAQLSNVEGVAVDGTGRIYICDNSNNRIRRIDLDATIHTVAGNGSYSSTGDGGPATSASLSAPMGISIDAMGRLLIADTEGARIRRVELDGTINTIAGTGTGGFAGDGGPATSANLRYPLAVASDSLGRVLIADRDNERIRRVALDGTISTLAGDGTVFPTGNGDGGPAVNAPLTGVEGVVVDGQGNIFIADTENLRIRRIGASDGIITTFAGDIDPQRVGPVATARLADPQAIATAGALAVVAGGTSLTLEAIRDGRVEAIAGAYPAMVSTGALARFRDSTFGTVGGTAIDDTTGTIYLTETSHNRIHAITQVDPAKPSTWTIATIANTSGVAGSSDGSAASASFRAPSGLYLDAPNHRLYIADTGNHAIRALDLATNMVTTIVNTNHTLGYAGDAGPAASALLFAPTAITVCPDGDVFVADTGNNRVRRIAGGIVTTVLGDGIAASSGEGAPAQIFPVDQPRGLACDGTGNLFVSSGTTVRLLLASDTGLIDGSGRVQTIYGAPPRSTFPSSNTGCLTGIEVTSSTTLLVADACSGLLVRVDRVPAP